MKVILKFYKNRPVSILMTSASEKKRFFALFSSKSFFSKFRYRVKN